MTADIFDFLLVMALVGFGGYLLLARDLFRSIVLYIVFGLFVSLAWVRLGAPDVALAEAAIGAGVTGALLLRASALQRKMGNEEETHGVFLGAALAGGALLFTVSLTSILLSFPPLTDGLAGSVLARLPESGVTNPVTAVLLNFRGYDTLLEIGVLLLALLGVWSLGPAGHLPTEAPGPVLGAYIRLISPLLVLSAGYLLWLGAHAPGGAFQAAALLAGGGVLALLGATVMLPIYGGFSLRLLICGGLILFVAVAAGVMVPGGTLLEYPPEGAKGLILLIEGGLTLSIAAILIVLFAGGRPGGDL